MQILCFGDSNTYGYDPRGFLGGRYEPEDRWVDLLAAQTGQALINAGVNGREIPRCLPPEYLPVDVLLVMLGTNDLLQGASVKEAAARMDSFLQSAIPHCCHVLLVTPPPLKRGAWVPSDTLVTESIHLTEEYRHIAEKRDISFVDTRSWDIPLTFDGVHFTEVGHRRFAARLQPMIHTILQESKP